MRNLLVFLLFCCSCFGQGSSTIFQQVFTNSAGGTSAVVQNIGQPYHLAYAVFSDAPSHTCAVPATGVFSIPLVAIKESFDGVVFQDVSNVVRVVNPGGGGATNRYRMLVSASGNFPYITVAISNFDTTNCVVNAWYSGGLVAVDVKKVFGFTTNYVDAGVFQQFDISSATTTDIILANASGQIAIYGLWLYNSTTAQSIAVKEVKSDSSVTTRFTFDTVAANTAILWPNTGVPYMQTSVGSKIQFTTGAAGPLSGFVIYRQE